MNYSQHFSWTISTFEKNLLNLPGFTKLYNLMMWIILDSPKDHVCLSKFVFSTPNYKILT